MSSSCGSKSVVPEKSQKDSQATGFELSKDVQVNFVSGDGRVGSYTSSWKGFRTTSYWIEGPEGLILIDAQFLLSAAEEMVNLAEKITGKKAVLAIVLHPNPDKFNGTALFQKRGIKVVTSDQVRALIPSVHKLRMGWFYDKFKPDYPAEEPKLDTFGPQTTELSAAGLKVKAHVLGAGCSEAHVVVEYDKHLFVGDLVTQGFHSWLELGMLKPWIQRMDELEALKPKYVHMGRGGSGDIDSIRREQQYLKTVLEIVQKERPRRGQALSEATSKKLMREITARYPSYEYPNFVSNGLEEVWKKAVR
jgi:glyoxylase-like metal-dependent hydrolase (beta-lactamase superfamily II)